MHIRRFQNHIQRNQCQTCTVTPVATIANSVRHLESAGIAGPDLAPFVSIPPADEACKISSDVSYFRDVSRVRYALVGAVPRSNHYPTNQTIRQRTVKREFTR